ncbi:MAG: histidine triad nucleotide-binding protein [Nitrospirota bacterium]
MSASTSTCLFCRIVRRELPATIVHEDDEVLAFQDIAPKAPVHLLVIPKRHLDGLQAVTADNASIMAALFACVGRLATKFGVAESGYRTVVNVGADGGQTVFHLHVHVLGGRPMAWPPG